MPRIDWNRVLWVQLSILASIVLLVVAWTALHAVVHTILLFVLAAVLAFVLAPLVTRLVEQGLPRVAAVAVVYLVLALVLVVTTGLLSRPFLAQATLLIQNTPFYLTGLQEQLGVLEEWLSQFGLGGTVAALEVEASRQATGAGTSFLGDFVRLLSQFASSALDAILTIVISFYLVLDGPRLRTATVALVPRRHHAQVMFVEESLIRVLGGYLRGQLLMALTLAIMVGAGMQLLGIPYAIVLAVLAGFFELVPMLGPILSALPALVVALFLPFPTVLWVLLFFVVIQQVESNVLAPRITAHAVGLHPLGAIFALMAGFEIGGALGAVFAVPVAGFLWVLLTTLYRRTVGADEPQPRAGWRLPRRRPQPTTPGAPGEPRPVRGVEQP